MSDDLEDSRTTKDAGLLLQFRVEGYGLSACVSRNPEADPVECNGWASIELDAVGVEKLKKAIDDYERGRRLARQLEVERIMSERKRAREEKRS